MALFVASRSPIVDGEMAKTVAMNDPLERIPGNFRQVGSLCGFVNPQEMIDGFLRGRYRKVRTQEQFLQYVPFCGETQAIIERPGAVEQPRNIGIDVGVFS